MRNPGADGRCQQACGRIQTSSDSVHCRKEVTSSLAPKLATGSNADEVRFGVQSVLRRKDAGCAKSAELARSTLHNPFFSHDRFRGRIKHAAQCLGKENASVDVRARLSLSSSPLSFISSISSSGDVYHSTLASSILIYPGNFLLFGQHAILSRSTTQ